MKPHISRQPGSSLWLCELKLGKEDPCAFTGATPRNAYNNWSLMRSVMQDNEFKALTKQPFPQQVYS